MLVEKALGLIVKLILAPAGPLQYFFDATEETHVRFLEQSYTVLSRDGKIEIVNYFKPWHTPLSEGLLWADRGWKNIGHYFSRPGKQGILRWPGATTECQYYFNKAVFTGKKDIEKSMFYLGAAIHVLQDMCVPHHSVGALFDGHQEFEKWAYFHWKRFPVTENGLYLPYSHPVQWIQHNALASAPFYPLVSLEKGCSEKSYRKAAAALVPLTICTTAGFLSFAKNQLDQI